MEAVAFLTSPTSHLPPSKLPRFFSSHPSRARTLRLRKLTTCFCSISPVAVQRSEHDVVVVGAGIIGLTIARHLLLETDLSVAIVDARVPCSGATGAGQGYIWMGHKTPRDDIWELAMRSKQLWEDLAASIEHGGMNPSQVLGWRRTGSLLIGRTSEESAMLEKRVRILLNAGLRAEYLSPAALLSKEPEIDVGENGSAAFFPDDCQLDAMQTVAYIEKDNRLFASEGRYMEFYDNPALCLIRSSPHGEVEAIQTVENILFARKAIIIAAGAWSGSLMQSLVKSDHVPNIPVKPRKGHLLVVENNGKTQLNHGMMEVGYINHLVTEGDIKDEQNISSISMTATTDTMGNLVLGSSREFSGFSTEVDEDIIKKIWERAGEFFPSLRELPFNLFLKRTRVGLRPWMPDGKPIISSIPGLPKVIAATGHEGGGLCLALGTAEMVADIILGNTTRVAQDPFSFHGRYVSIGDT